jgi:hypothetical protein
MSVALPNKPLQPTPGSGGRSAARFTSLGPAWLSFCRSPFASLRENAALSGSCLPSAPRRENQALETDPPSGDRSAPR